MNEQTKLDLLGIYLLGDDGSLQYLGGKVVDGRMEAKLPRPGKIIVLSYDRTFDDVPAAHWAHTMLKQMAAYGLVQGVSDTEYDPERSVTRAEFTAMLVRMLGLEQQKDAVHFADVKPSGWYVDVVAAASTAGLVSGTSTSTFEPDRTITREEMVIMMVRAYQMKAEAQPSQVPASDFANREQTSDWAIDALDKAKAPELVSGRGNNQFVLKGLTNRVEAAQAVYNLYTLLE